MRGTRPPALFPTAFLMLALVGLGACTATTGGAPGRAFGAAGGGGPGAQQDPRALQPRSAEPQGALAPAGPVGGVVAGNTVVLLQPWVGLGRYEVRETPIYFAADRRAHAREWSEVPWSADAHVLCTSLNARLVCYEALSDPTGQAYLLSRDTGLLARVQAIETGDSRGVRAAFAENQRIAAAQARQMNMIIGLIGEAIIADMMTPDVIVIN